MVGDSRPARRETEMPSKKKPARAAKRPAPKKRPAAKKKPAPKKAAPKKKAPPRRAAARAPARSEEE